MDEAATRPGRFGRQVYVGLPDNEARCYMLRRAMADRSLVFPKLAERESQYASHTYTVGHQGRIVYDKGNDHIIDADRCAALCRYLDTLEPDVVPLGVQVEGF